MESEVMPPIRQVAPVNAIAMEQTQIILHENNDEESGKPTLPEAEEGIKKQGDCFSYMIIQFNN